MTTIKFLLKKKPNSVGTYPICIQLIKDRKNTTLSLSKAIKLEDWSSDTQRVKSQHRSNKAINNFINKYQNLLEDHIHDLELKGVEYSLADLVSAVKSGFSTKGRILSYTQYQQSIIDENAKTAKRSTNNFYKDTLNSIKRCAGKEEIHFYEITPNFLFKYETYMRSNSISDATIGIRMRTLRSVINKAIKSELIPESYYPFRTYKIKNARNDNSKEILTVEELEKLKEYIPLTPNLELAKDMFLFSYYSRGINFIDLLQLKPQNITNLSITYIRSKTGVVVSFKLYEKSEAILNRYKDVLLSSPYLFPFLRISNPEKNTIDNLKKKKLKQINKSLKLIMQELSIKKNITYYCARHTFATHLKFNNISIDIIREALGHKDINSTISYLKTLPSNQLDKIIEDVIR